MNLDAPLDPGFRRDDGFLIDSKSYFRHAGESRHPVTLNAKARIESILQTPRLRRNERIWHLRARIGLLAPLALPLLLAGCLASGNRIVAPDTAVTPFEAGTWQQETLNSVTDVWAPAEKPLVVTLAGKAYRITAPGENQVVTASFHPMEGTSDLLLVLEGAGEDGKPSFFYAIARPQADGIHVSDAECKQSMGEALAPFGLTGNRFDCTVGDHAGLERFLASRSEGDLTSAGRFRRLGP